ncbi:MAG: ComF family protein [Rhodoferax sp.]|jgi:ComF family protein
MLRRLTQRLLEALPSQCAVCHAWPTQAVCEACITRFAQPQTRCRTCALQVALGVQQCSVCVRTPPPLDLCLAAVSYAFPWSDLIVNYKFYNHPGRASAFALLLRSTPWVEPALEAADWVLPLPLSPQRLKTRGYNQALLLAQRLTVEKTDPHLLRRVKDTPPQSSLERSARLDNVRHAFAVPPHCAARLRDARLVLVDDVMTSGASLYTAAHVLRAAGAAHITGLVIARTE